jgi:exo-1,4-beta-D-glucosaminidase
MRYFIKKNLFLILIVLLITISYSTADNNKINIKNNWYIASCEKVKFSGKKISSPDYKPDLQNWFKSSVPSTVLSTLINNGVYKNIYFNKNLDKINKKPFSVPWWYRKEFTIVNKKGRYFRLLINGINYKADIYVNGKKIADLKKVFGAFRRFDFDITSYMKKGKNILLFKIYPPEKGDYTIGFVDWNPQAPDKNMGIWRTVELKESGIVSLDNVFTKPILDTKTMNGIVEVYGKLKNNSNTKVKGEILIRVEETGLQIYKKYEIPPMTEKNLLIEKIRFNNPKLWWPNGLGEPFLYHLSLKVKYNREITDDTRIRFGIRKIEDYMTTEGVRGYKINGKKILIKGGGWVDDLTLANNKKNIETQIKYIKDMNLNTIRLEGFWGNSQYMYDLADENGLLIMVGFSCHWEWKDYLGTPVNEKFNGPTTKGGITLITDYLKDQIIWLRNHPSVFVWAVGSDKIPYPELEKKYINIMKKYDGTRPYIAATKEFTSKISGKTGIKMRGPYAFTVPVYWFEDKDYGGAFGFNSETGPGAQIPVLESLKKMIPEDKLWPINDEWDYHCARNEFKDISRFVKGLNERYGKSDDLNDFVKKAQIMNYELIKPMFEAFSVNRYKTTGIIQWMLNSAWPEMYWQLYDWYLIPTAAYYGVKEGAKPLHIVYRYGFDDIWVVNEKFEKQDNLIAEVKVFDYDSNLIFNRKKEFFIEENRAIPLKIKLSDSINKNRLSFISLKLYKNNRELDSNFYWVSNKKDIPDYENSDWFITPLKQYADFSKLNHLPKTELEITKKYDKNRVELIIKNKTNKIAFFIDIKVLNENGELLVPVTLSDNYFSILPDGEKKVDFNIYDNRKIIVVIEGWNTNALKININPME